MSAENFKLHIPETKKEKSKKKLKPFKHLKGQIDANAIENTPVHLYDEERLPESRNHFLRIKEKHSSNPDIVKAADNIINKIEHIINLWKKDFSWEIMRAANDDNYSEKYKSLNNADFLWDKNVA